MATKPTTQIDSFSNPNPERDYEILIECPEFTCICPLTSQPDFADIEIRYVPDLLCVELKSLKMYFWGFRDRGAFHEAITNEILSHLVEKTSPRFMEIKARFKARGGITTTVTATHKKS